MSVIVHPSLHTPRKKTQKTHLEEPKIFQVEGMDIPKQEVAKSSQSRFFNRKKSNRRFFHILKKQAFPFFSTGHFEKVEAIWELNGTTNETYRAKTLASPGRPQKVSMIYLLRFRRYMPLNI